MPRGGQPPATPDADYLTVREIAARLRIGPCKVLTWIRDGSLEAVDVSDAGVKSGRPTWRIPREAFDRLLRDRRAVTAAKVVRNGNRRRRKSLGPVTKYF